MDKNVLAGRLDHFDRHLKENLFLPVTQPAHFAPLGLRKDSSVKQCKNVAIILASSKFILVKDISTRGFMYYPYFSHRLYFIKIWLKKEHVK